MTAIFGPWAAPFISHTTVVIGMGLGVPHGGILGSGNVSATTAMTLGPGRKLQIPRHRFKKKTNLLLPLHGNTLLQLTTNYTFDGPRAKATLASMGGPGSQTWCPSNPVCLPSGWIPGAPPNIGRVIYRKGPRQFGGAMQMGLKGCGDNAIPFGSGRRASALRQRGPRVRRGRSCPAANWRSRLVSARAACRPSRRRRRSSWTRPS